MGLGVKPARPGLYERRSKGPKAQGCSPLIAEDSEILRRLRIATNIIAPAQSFFLWAFSRFTFLGLDSCKCISSQTKKKTDLTFLPPRAHLSLRRCFCGM